MKVIFNKSNLGSSHLVWLSVCLFVDTCSLDESLALLHVVHLLLSLCVRGVIAEALSDVYIDAEEEQVDRSVDDQVQAHGLLVSWSSVAVVV